MIKICLKCQKEFESKGQFNRICTVCNAYNAKSNCVVPQRGGIRVIRKIGGLSEDGFGEKAE